MRTPLPGQLEPMRPRGPQCFVDWRYVRAGFVGWYSRGQRIGVWDQAPSDLRGEPNAPSGLRLQAQPATQIGPIIERDRPWEYTYHINTVMYDGGVYRAWYECVPSDHFQSGNVGWPLGHGNVLCYAESDDGFVWRKPSLNIAAYHGEERTNIVYGRDLSPNGLHGCGVFVDPHAPSSERYKLIYMGMAAGVEAETWRAKYRPRFGDDMDPMCFRTDRDQARRQLVASGHYEPERSLDRVFFVAGAVSPDGLRWSALAEPLMVHFSDTLNNAYWDSALRRYVGYFRTWRYGRRCVGRAETPEFHHWPSTPDTVLEAPLDRHPSDDVYTNAKIIYPGSGDTHLMFPAIYHRLDDSRQVYMAASVDGVNWQWVPGGPVVSRGQLGNWDGGDVSASIGMVSLAGDRIGVPISAYRHPHKYPRGSEPFGAPGWATWPKGRLCALIADERGEFSTPSLIFEGRSLVLNLETHEAGQVLVEIQDERGAPIPGFTFDDADPIVADQPDARVTWRGNPSIGRLAGQPIALAFRLRRAKLYGFEFVT